MPFTIWAVIRTHLESQPSLLSNSPTFNNLASNLRLEESHVLLVVAALLFVSIVVAISNEARNRNDLRYYQDFLSEVIDAREVEES
jgi:hypothetical protein